MANCYHTRQHNSRKNYQMTGNKQQRNMAKMRRRNGMSQDGEKGWKRNLQIETDLTGQTTTSRGSEVCFQNLQV